MTGKNNKKNKYFLLVIAAIVLFSAPDQFISALELEYPSFSPLFPITANTTLAEYFKYIFIFLIISAGTIGIISIVYSGFKILLSFGKPEAISSARENILSIAIGLTLLMSSFIILNTINPELVSLDINSTIALQQRGVYLRTTKPNGEYQYSVGVPSSVSNTENLGFLSSGANPELFYFCDDQNETNLLVWQYDEVNFGLGGLPITVSVECNTAIPMDPSIVKSFQRSYEDAGIYFYETNDCGAGGPTYSSDLHKSSGVIRFPRGIGQVRSMRIVSGLDKNKRYGAILSKEGANDGECGEPLIKLFPGSTCFNLDIYYDLDGNPFKDPQYVNILKVNPDFDDSGTNVFFDSDHLFARLSQDITQTDFPYIDNIFLAKYHFGTTIKNRSPDRIIRQQYKKIGHWYTDAAPRENECCVEVGVDDDGNDLPDCGDKGTCGCTDVDPEGTCLKNIEVQGSYYIVFYSHNEKGRANRFCQILTGDQGNIGVSTDLLGGERKLYDFAVIPKY